MTEQHQPPPRRRRPTPPRSSSTTLISPPRPIHVLAFLVVLLYVSPGTVFAAAIGRRPEQAAAAAAFAPSSLGRRRRGRCGYGVGGGIAGFGNRDVDAVVVEGPFPLAVRGNRPPFPTRLYAQQEEEEESAPDGEGSARRLNIAFVTGNQMKAREVELILAEHGSTAGPEPGSSLVELRMLNVDLPEIQEINTEAIAKNKAIQGAQLAGGPCVVEDTALKFNALGGMPGPFIKWFQDKLKSDGLYKILTDYDDKSATAVCTLAFCPAPHADPVVFTGKTRGTIVAPVEGRGFGWDSIFVPDGEDLPFSCMSTEEKCRLSHRGKAVRQWADWLGVNKAQLWERQEGRQIIGHKGLNFKSDFAEQ